VTVRALVGLFGLNLLYLAVGSSLVWALRGWRSWAEYLRFAGLAYLLGVATLGIIWTLLLVVGVPLGAGTIVVAPALVVVVGLGVGAKLRRERPSLGRFPRLTLAALAAAAGIGLAGLLLESLFRAARLHPLVAFDAWAFWVPKAIAIYDFDELDEQLFTQLPGPTYPPLVPIVDAVAFHAMGSADVVTLHVQYWFFVVGFATAIAGLTWRRVPAWILWPFLLLTLAAPRMSEHLVTAQADFLLQFFFSTAVVLGALWLGERMLWQIAAITVLLGAAVLTKREGLLLAAILFAALALASLDRWRFALPRIALSLAAVAVIAAPWRLWYRARGVGGEAPVSPDVGLERAQDALRLSVEVFLDGSLWSVLTPLAVVSVVFATVWGSRRLALLFGVVLGLIVLGGAWITIAYPDLPVTAEEALNPIVRYTASAALVGGIAAPMLLGDMWLRTTSRERAGE
jgi:hypothetical protein